MSTIICGMGNRNVVGIRVRKARMATKPRITQKELIARLQVLGMMIDQSGLSKIENGQRPVTDKEVVALAKALKVSPMSLLQEAEDLEKPEADKDEIP
jgi:transcriptional regulator with XRE-family HTH domain